MATTDNETQQMDAAGAQDSQNARSRWRVSARETNVLEAVFSQSPRPNKNTIVQLATMLGVKPRQVQVWFQNRRQRWRKDFLELERARTQQMAELSGKVIDFHGDLLPPLPTGASAENTAVAMPAGWEGLLLQPGITPLEAAAAAAAAPAAGQSVQVGAQPAPTMQVEPKPAPQVKAEPESTPVPVTPATPTAPINDADRAELKSQLDTLDELDICDLFNFPAAAPAPADTKVLADMSLQRSPTDLSLNCSPPKSPDATDSDDTIWLGMEWLIADSDELMNQPIPA